jgi:hypothetical protein
MRGGESWLNQQQQPFTQPQQWFKRFFFSLLRKTLIVASLVTLGSYLEYKYHWLGASHANVQAVAKKGAK